MSVETTEDDEAFLRSLIRPEEDRRRLHPELPWRGGYRWFRSAMLYRWRDTGSGERPS